MYILVEERDRELEFNPAEFAIDEDDMVEVTEEDIFKFLVKNEDMEQRQLKENIKRFFNRVPINIFKDEYYLIYKVLEHTNKYNTYFDLSDIFYVITNNEDEILKDYNISLFKDISDEEERVERIIQTVMTEYEYLSELEHETDSDRMFAMLEIYINNYVRGALETLNNRTTMMFRGDIKSRNRTRFTIQEVKEYKIKVEKSLYNLLDEELEKLSPEINTATMTVDEIRERLEDEDVLEIVSILGIDSIDSRLEGLRKGEYWAIQAGSGVGKTKCAINMAYNSIINGQNVLVDSIELTTRKVFLKILAKHIYVLYEGDMRIQSLHEGNLIKNRVPMDAQQYYDRALTDLVTNENYGKVLVSDEQVLIDNFEERLERHWDGGFHFDVYVLDYIGIVGSKDSKRGKTEIVARTSNTLKRLVKNFKGQGFGAVVVVQLSKDGEKALLEGSSGAKLSGADSMEVLRDCDVLLTMFQTEEMKINRMMKFYIDKSRNESMEDGSDFDVHVHLGFNMFYSLDEE